MDLSELFIQAAQAAQEVPAELTQAATDAAAHETGGPLGTLGIDWKLFLAQLVNFGIVLFVFWKWVVQPLGQTLTKRQEKIESGLKNAAYMEEEKQKFEEWKAREMQKVRSESEKILNTASETAEQIKQETTASARRQADLMVEQAKKAMDHEKQAMLKEVRTELSELVVAATEKILRKKLDQKTDAGLISESLKTAKQQ